MKSPSQDWLHDYETLGKFTNLLDMVLIIKGIKIKVAKQRIIMTETETRIAHERLPFKI